MNKDLLVKNLAKKFNLHNAEMKKYVESLFNLITDQVKNGKKVHIVGFGSFEAKKRASRTGTDPQSGKKIIIPETKTPVFTAGTALKKAVKN